MKKVYVDRSRILEYQRCPRSRYLAYHHGGMGLSSAKTPLPLGVGASVHEGLAQLLRYSQLAYDSHLKEFGTVADWPVNEDEAVEVALADFSQYRSRLELDTSEQAAWQSKVAIPDDQFREQMAATLGMSVEDAGLAMLQQDAAKGAREFDDYLWNEQSALVEGIVRAYARRRLKPLLEQYEVLEVEREGQWLLSEWSDRIDTCTCGYQNDPYKAPEQHADNCPRQRELWFMSRPDAILRDRSDNNLYILSFKTAASWDVRKARDAEHDMQGLSEGVEVERRLGEWYTRIMGLERWEQFEKEGCGRRTFEYLCDLSAPPRILGIRYEYLLKGERWKDKDLSARVGFEARSQRSILTRAYQGKTGDLNCEWDFIKETGEAGKLAWQSWKSRPLHELGIDIKTWIDMLDDSQETMSAYDSTTGMEPRSLGWKSRAQATGFLSQHPLDSIFIPPVIVYRQEDDLRDWIEQTEAQERRVAEGIAQIQGNDTDIRSLLNNNFPQHRQKCEYPSTCQFVPICYGGEDMRHDPLSSGRYRMREPNHPQEKVK